MTDERASLRIGELARRAGVPAATLRSWERRYSIVEPERTESGYRLYSERDERRLRAMVELITRGLAPAEAAERVRATEAAEPRAADRAAAAETVRKELLAAVRAFDETGAHRAIDRAVDAYSTETLLAEVILPALRRTGELWSDGEVTVGHEHFVSNLIRGRLLAIARGWGAGVGPAALLACPHGEEHELGLIAFGLLLRERGWRIVLLGADTPLTTLADAAATLAPRVAVLAVTDQGAAEALQAEAPVELAAPLLLGGASSSAALAEHLGAVRLPDDLVAAADEVVATVRGA